MARAFITGITGQDGWYLSELLLADGYEVHGLVSTLDRRSTLPPGVKLVQGDLLDEASVGTAILAAEPHEVYNLAAVSSVKESWTDPVRTAKVNGLGALYVLDAAATVASRVSHRVSFVQASSAEVFGNAIAPQNEQTPLAPTNPYGASKVFAQCLVAAYRHRGLHASSAIMYNHESPRRPSRFVSQKIASGVVEIASGREQALVLGNLNARRDWGHAQDFVRAMALMARAEAPVDLVIGSGVTHTVGEFAALAFAQVGISAWRDYVRLDQKLERPGDVGEQRGNPTLAHQLLHWDPTVSFEDLVKDMVLAAIASSTDTH